MATSPSKRRPRRRRRITPEDLRGFMLLSDPRISPEGDAIVFVHRRAAEAPGKYDTNLWIVPVEAGDPRPGGEPRPFTSGNADSQPRWSPDGSRVAFVRAPKDTAAQVHVIPSDGGEAVGLTSFPEGAIGTIKWSPDGSMLAVSFRQTDEPWTRIARKQREARGASEPPRVLDHWWYRLDGEGYFNGRRHHLYLIDAETGEARVVFDKDQLGFFSFDFSPDSRELVIGTNRHRRAGLGPWRDDLLRLRISTGRITPVPNLPDGPKDAVAWSPDGKWIAFAGRDGGPDGTYSTENLELWICDPRTGKARSLTGREDYCLMSAPMSDTAEVAFYPVFRWSRDSRRIYMQLGHHGEMHLASVRRAGGPIRFHTSGRRVHQMGNISDDGRSLALTVGSANALDEVHVARLGDEDVTPTALTALNKPLLAELDLARPTSHWVRSADGSKVQVWVMRPPGAGKTTRGPAVLEIHGGPHAQYGVGFFHEFQVLAAAGYTVFYSNPRGSKGYGRDHCAAIRGDWGNADWTDVEAVIDFMTSSRFIDPERMGVMGGSYGGYMTNWAIGHTNAFAGAITDRCVSNFVSMSGSSDFVDSPDLYFEGNAWDRTETRWRCSPLKYIGKARTPTLIIHSEGDLRCNIEQAEQVFAALTVLKVPTRFVRYPASTSHGLSRSGPPDLRIHRLEQILAWWGKYLKRR